MSVHLPAADPTNNAAVLASAGTGKTWLLVTRMVRLLLAGARPEGILAITFTRKAAAEMLARLNQRLRLYAGLNDAELAGELQALGAPTDREHLSQARRLYERMLFAERPLRATTFHAFCQEILQRFPLEADIAPDFELLDTSGLLEQQAWEALYTEATRTPESPLAAALETLLDRCGGLHNTQTALASFLSHRSDWWAFTETWADPVADAGEHIATALAIEPDADPLRDLQNTAAAAAAECMELLRRHDTATNRSAVANIEAWLNCESPDLDSHARMKLAFFTQGGDRRKRKASGAQRKSLGDAGEQRLLALHEQLCACIEQSDQDLARLHSLALNRAWYCAGHRLIEHFQRLKREQRLLDFNDLEWRTYRLLNRADNAHWVQYKLDQRIDHLLIDEFQDTNPTQWRLLTPLLEELAAAEQERPRSVFLVGDDKQSIYRFRRAEPELLGSAARWLQQHMAARTETLEKSRRSSPAIMQCINAVFEGPLAGVLPGFRCHDTHHTELWGAVEVMPLAEDAAETPDAPERAGLRNPLLEPRRIEEDRRQQHAAQQVAARIAALMQAQTPVREGPRTRALRYDDIYILMRKRTHAGILEQALREAGIPYVGAGRGTLLDSLEVSDMEALLNVLTTPYDNLSLAQVLRAPLFTCSETDLLRLAEQAGRETWRAALDSLAPQLPEDHSLARAQRLLSRWEVVAGRIPVHDLLDRIYHEGNVPARYEAAYPDALRVRVRANLARFISLALEVDSGRYPSLPHFIARLRKLRRHTLEAPDEPPSDNAEARVRLLTVHAAKGLEAPVVFLVDAASSAPARRAYHGLVDWPPGAPQPRQFVLTTPARARDPFTRQLLEQEQAAETREDRNLLYVALTRPRQYLFVSASAPRNGDQGWYGHVREALASLVEPGADGSLRLQYGQPGPLDPIPAPQTATVTPDPRLRSPLTAQEAPQALMPSATAEPGHHRAAEEDGRPRGIALHRLLELLSSGMEAEQAVRRTAMALDLPAGTAQLRAWLTEAQTVLQAPHLSHLFDPAQYREAFNEIPVQYALDSRPVSGVIDRLLVRDHEVLVVDYKSHRCAGEQERRALAASFAPQLRLYAEAAQRLWPDHRVRALLLFTQDGQLDETDLE